MVDNLDKLKEFIMFEHPKLPKMHQLGVKVSDLWGLFEGEGFELAYVAGMDVCVAFEVELFLARKEAPERGDMACEVDSVK